MRTYRIIAIIILLSFGLMQLGCSANQTSRDDPKAILVKSYMTELFQLDAGLLKRYTYKTPLPANYDPPILYVDQRYIRDNPRLREYLEADALRQPNLVDSYFCVPVGMQIKLNNGELLGKVIGIEKVEDVFIRGDAYPHELMRYPTEVTTLAKLDTGREVEVRFNFDVSLTQQSSKYVIQSASLDTVPWVVKRNIFWWQGPTIKIKD